MITPADRLWVLYQIRNALASLGVNARVHNGELEFLNTTTGKWNPPYAQGADDYAAVVIPESGQVGRD